MSDRNILISGCSGGGKSTLLDALGDLGHATVPEPGRRIVERERVGTGAALPWVDLKAFAHASLKLAKTDLDAVKKTSGLTFFDRGMVDAAVALEFAGGPALHVSLGNNKQYARRVFLAPPWPEIFVQDSARKHGFAEAEAEYLRLTRAFSVLGYETFELPKASVRDRVACVLNTLNPA